MCRPAVGWGRLKINRFELAKRWLWLVPALLVFGLILINVTVIAAPFPRFCQPCHRPAYSGWATSPHQKVACHSCHQGAGVLGQTSQRFRIVSMFGGTILGNRNASTDVKQDNCLACHEGIKRGTVRSNGLIMSHKEIIAAGTACGECHRKAVHGAGPQYKVTSMDKCLRCHLEEGADTDCSTCHNGNARLKKSKDATPWRVAHGPKWRSNHGLLDLELCSACHTTQYCFRCHRIRDLPHSSGWLNLHGKIAKRQRGDCLVCHRESLCDRCHTVEMPHNSKWLSRHFVVAKERGAKICLGCHMARGCDDCHEKHVHGVELGRLQEKFFNQGKRWDGSP